MKTILSQHKGRITEQHGGVAIIVGLLLPVLIGVAAFAVDFGYTHVVKNELQNAADAAALAGAGVLFDPTSPNTIRYDIVPSTAQDAASANTSGGKAIQGSNFAISVYIGHYAFADNAADPGTFTGVTEGTAQLSGWQTMNFRDLNSSTQFINAVEVNLSRSDVPAFFSKIFGESVFTISVKSIAYRGFAATLPPGTAKEPIAICEDAIKDPDTGNYSCNIGRMLSDNNNSCNSGGQATETGMWTNFTQYETTGSCDTASDRDMRDLICGAGNPTPIHFGEGLGASNATQGNTVTAIYDCWNPDPANPQPLALTLPVVDCKNLDTGEGGVCEGAEGVNLQNCPCVVGAVDLNVVWIVDKNDPQMKEVPRKMGKAPESCQDDSSQNVNGDTWNAPTACDSLPECTGSSTTNCRGQCVWDSFVNCYGLKILDDNCQLVPATTENSGYQDKAIYFLPDCTPHDPVGGPGGHNFGVMAKYPVLVK